MAGSLSALHKNSGSTKADPGKAHRHAPITMIAYAFIADSQLLAGKKNQQATAATDPASRARQAILELIARLPPQRCPL